jgi:PadR family transcriptional regulator, regulatory protein PadR
MLNMMTEELYLTQLNKLIQELRRGILVLAVLSQLKSSKYGYSLINDLSEQGIEIDQGTLYPLLRRLEADGLLQSEWNVEGSRPRRYYRISMNGEKLLDSLKEEWRTLSGNLNRILSAE